MSWSDRWAYNMAQGSMTTQQDQTRAFGSAITDAITDLPFINETTDFIGDATDFIQDPSAGDFFEIATPAVVEDVFDGGGLDDLGYIPIIGDAVDGNGYTIGPGDIGVTIGPNAPKPQAPSAPIGSCPTGFVKNPKYNPNQAMLRVAGGTTRATQNPCIPNPNNNTTPDGVPSSTTPMVPGLDENCDEIPKEYKPPVGCVPSTGKEVSPFFEEQKKACHAEWKHLEGLEDELKARYEQLCMAREKYNQRQERYGGVCGPYEVLFGIEQAKGILHNEKEKKKADCLNEKNKKGHGCGCVHKTSSGCGCGCSGKSSTDMEFEYEDPVKSACKRTVEASFNTSVKRAKRNPPRAAKTSCMPCALKSKPKKKVSTRKLRKPKKTVAPIPKPGRRKAVTTATKKRQCVQI